MKMKSHSMKTYRKAITAVVTRKLAGELLIFANGEKKALSFKRRGAMRILLNRDYCPVILNQNSRLVEV